MMRLELNKMEGEILLSTLETSLSRLSDEISHTDSHEYREFLKGRKEVLIKLREKMH